jgi:hypothetical protein
MKRSFRVPGASGSSDVEREIENHIELRAREFEAAGMSKEDARRGRSTRSATGRRSKAKSSAFIAKRSPRAAAATGSTN